MAWAASKGRFVLYSKVQDDDELVDVVFESVGIKRLAASLANLKILYGSLLDM